MNGTLSSTIGDLKSIKYFFLDHNAFSGKIPSNLGNLDNLRILYLSSNKFKGEFPATFGSLKSLETLNLQNLHLTGAIPETMCQISALRSINITGNSVCYPGCLSSLFGDDLMHYVRCQDVQDLALCSLLNSVGMITQTSNTCSNNNYMYPT